MKHGDNVDEVVLEDVADHVRKNVSRASVAPCGKRSREVLA
jgi:hypothetical protein